MTAPCDAHYGPIGLSDHHFRSSYAPESPVTCVTPPVPGPYEAADATRRRHRHRSNGTCAALLRAALPVRRSHALSCVCAAPRHARATRSCVRAGARVCICVHACCRARRRLLRRPPSRSSATWCARRRAWRTSAGGRACRAVTCASGEQPICPPATPAHTHVCCPHSAAAVAVVDRFDFLRDLCPAPEEEDLRAAKEVAARPISGKRKSGNRPRSARTVSKPAPQRATRKGARSASQAESDAKAGAGAGAGGGRSRSGGGRSAKPAKATAKAASRTRRAGGEASKRRATKRAAQSGASGQPAAKRKPSRRGSGAVDVGEAPAVSVGALALAGLGTKSSALTSAAQVTGEDEDYDI